MKRSFCCLALLLLTVPTFAVESKKLALSLPGPPRLAIIANPRVAELIAKNKKFPTTKGFRELSDLYLQINRPTEAAAALRAEAALHQRRGFNDAAIKQGLRAARYESNIKLFLARPVTKSEVDAAYTHALFEPPVGAYLGAYIDYDEQLPTKWQDENGRWHRNPDEFAKLAGRPHATFFMYKGWGSEFPRQWLQKIKDAGAIAHLALEPDNLDQVKNDAYLQTLAKELGHMDMPIFLRYASEMNGSWTKWHGDPKKYREKFRLVNSVMKKYAPRVAMVWCPNAVPLDNIMDYYPGDDACDWVGVNVYSVPFYDNDPRNSAELDSPLALIEPLYKAFAARKPIAICEYGASQMSAADKKPRAAFAITKMTQLYSALPRLYPRIKMISWFDINTMKYAPPGRQLNNYSLSETERVLDAYRQTIASPYFISGGDIMHQINANLKISLPQPVHAGQIVTGAQADFSIWVKAPVARPKVYLQIGKKIVYAGQNFGAHKVSVDTKTIPSGAQPVTVYIYDELNRFISSRSVTLNFGKSRGNEPLQVTGNVLHYFGDAQGYVHALQMENAGEVSTIHFVPQLASQLLTDFPEGAVIDAWLKPFIEKGSGAFQLVGIGQEKPETWLDPETTIKDEEGKVLMKAPPPELSTSLLMQSDEIRMAGKQGLQIYAPKLLKERGDDVQVKPLMKENVRPW